MALPSLLPALLLVVTSHVLADTCPDRDAIATFDSHAFLGRWYTLKQTAIEINGTIDCLNMLVKPVREETHRLATHARYVDHTRLAIRVLLGVIFKEDNSSTNGKYLYSRRMSDTESNNKYYIIDTDFSNYAVTWYCFPLRDTGAITEVYSVLSRGTSLDQELMERAEQHLPEDGTYTTVSHDRCQPRSAEVLESDSASHSSTEQS